MRRKPAALAAFATVLLAAVPAQATFHFMKIVEVFPGTAVSPQAQYVVLQMYASDQHFVGGESVTIFNADGTQVHTYTFPSDLSPAGTNQRKILIATPEAVSFFGLSADLVMDASIGSAGGKACWAGTVDCVAWGNWSGSAAGVGPAFSPADGLHAGRAAKRRLDISGGSTTLDAADDTGSSVNDFVFGTPAPRNYANVNGTIPGSTCGNGALEGLEQCDDHNLTSGDGCSSTCQIDVPSTTLSVADASVTEGNGGSKSLVFTVSLSGPAASAVTFDVATANGTATAGSDYVAAAAAGQSISPGATSKTFAVTVNGDLDIEANEAFAVNVTNVVGASVIDGQATGTITNDDTNYLSVNDVAIAEGNSGTKVLNFTVSARQPTTQDVTFQAATGNGTATGGSDFTALVLSTSILAGQTSRTVGVTLLGDTTKEPDETFFLNLSNVQGGAALDGQGQGTITNDDFVLLSIADLQVSEGNSGTKVANLTVQLSQPASVPVTYDIATANGTATAGSDYVASSLAGQSIPAGSLTKSFGVTLNGDTTIEGNETFTVNVTNVAGASLSDGLATATILNDDPTLTINDVTLYEGNAGTKTATFTVSLSAISPNPVTYSIGTVNGAATAGSDYVASSLTGQTIPAGSLTKTFSITINGDTTVETNEAFSVVVSAVTGAGVGDGSGVGNIVNDDVRTLSIGDASVVEGNSGTKSLVFTVTLSQTSSSAVTYNIATADGTATAGSDYLANNLVGESIPAGMLSKTFSVTLNGDTTHEANEIFNVTVSAVSGATLGDGSAIGTLLNDDPTLTVNDLTLFEGNTGTKIATFTVSLSAISPNPVTYTIGTVNGAATAGSDYVASSLTGQTIPAGSLTKTFGVTINGDTTVETNEAFSVVVNSVVGAGVGDGTGVGNIVNDDVRTVSIGDASVVEGNSGTKSLVFTVALSQTSSSAVTYNIATANGTATAGSDYVASSLTGESIPAGSLSKTFSVTLNGDTTHEANETFAATLSAVSGATVGDGSAVGTILNDDPTLTINNVTVFEGSTGTKTAVFTVSLSQISPDPVTYTIGTVNGAALAGSDYVASTLVGETIPAGSLSKTFSVTINGDTAVETNEAFSAVVGAVTGAGVGDGTGVANIVNDD